MGLLFPRSKRRKKPRTVGGRIMGNVKIASRITLALGGRFITHRAAPIPRKKTIIVEIKVVFNETQRGVRSKAIIITRQGYKPVFFKKRRSFLGKQKLHHFFGLFHLTVFDNTHRVDNGRMAFRWRFCRNSQTL